MTDTEKQALADARRELENARAALRNGMVETVRIAHLKLDECLDRLVLGDTP